MYRVNGAGRTIIELGNAGFEISEIIGKAKIKREDVINYIKMLTGKGLVIISKEKPGDTADKLLSDDPDPELRFLWIEVTSRCNLRCLHCYADASPKRETDLPADIIKKAIDEAATMGCKNIQFTGGECLLRGDLGNLIAHARRLGFESIEIFTNGTLLAEPFVRFLKLMGAKVAVSLYSHDPAVHDAVTGVKGSFRRFYDNLEMLLAYKVPVRGALIVMKQNEKHIDDTASYFKRMGIVGDRPDPVRPGGRGKNYENWPHGFRLNRVKTAPGFRVDKAGYLCNVSWNSCWCGEAAVASNGDVLPCVFARGLVAGNIKEQGLSEIIQGNMRKYWSLNLDKVDVCRDCEYRYLCFDCRPYALGLTDDLHAKNPRCSYDPYTGQWGKPQDTLLFKTLTKLTK